MSQFSLALSYLSFNVLAVITLAELDAAILHHLTQQYKQIFVASNVRLFPSFITECNAWHF